MHALGIFGPGDERLANLLGVTALAAAGRGRGRPRARRRRARRTRAPGGVSRRVGRGAAPGARRLAPGAPGAAALAGAAFGASYNVIVAIQSIWTSVVFADRPSAGLAAVMFMLGLGLLAGPPLAGLLADELGLGSVLLMAAALVAATAALPPREGLIGAATRTRRRELAPAASRRGGS